MLTRKNRSDSDKDFVIGIIKGNANSFKSLYSKYYQQLINFAFYRVHSNELASNFVQEIFTRIWSRRNKLNQNKSIKAFLYKSLNNLIIDYYKSSESKNESLNNKIYENLSYSNSDIEEQIDIKIAISSLPEKLKIVFTLSRYDGYSYSEIAEICEMSKKGVEKRMSKAFILLRKHFS